MHIVQNSIISSITRTSQENLSCIASIFIEVLLKKVLKITIFQDAPLNYRDKEKAEEKKLLLDEKDNFRTRAERGILCRIDIKDLNLLKEEFLLKKEKKLEEEKLLLNKKKYLLTRAENSLIKNSLLKSVTNFMVRKLNRKLKGIADLETLLQKHKSAIQKNNRTFFKK